MKIKKGDTVKVLAGKYKGKTGKVHRVFPSESAVLVEGINVVKRHTKGRPGVRQAGIIEKEKPVAAGKVMLVCTKCGQPVRVGYRVVANEKIRFCRKCQEVIE